MQLQVKVDNVSNIELALSYMTLPHQVNGINMDIGEYPDELCEQLINAGDDHSKHMRMIQVWMRVRAPRYWWVEFDTYRVGVEKVSESTMHTLEETLKWYNSPITLHKACFHNKTSLHTVSQFLDTVLRPVHGASGVTLDIEAAKANLPEGWMQTRGMMVNYQTLRRIYHQRKNHRLNIWRKFLRQTLSQLPYPEWITTPDGPQDYL